VVRTRGKKKGSEKRKGVQKKNKGGLSRQGPKRGPSLARGGALTQSRRGREKEKNLGERQLDSGLGGKDHKGANGSSTKRHFLSPTGGGGQLTKGERKEGKKGFTIVKKLVNVKLHETGKCPRENETRNCKI